MADRHHPMIPRSKRRASSTGQLESWIATLTIAGYPTIAATSQLTGMDNRLMSIGIRGLLLAICLYLLSKYPTTKIAVKNFMFWAAWWFFWAAYLLRLSSDTLFAPIHLPLASAEYWVFAVGTCLIPATAASRGSIADGARLALDKLYWLLVLGAILNIIVMLTQHVIGEVDTLRAETEVLNPIALGHIGVSIFLLSAWKLNECKMRSAGNSAAIYASCAVAVFTIFISASKGPLLSLLISLSLYAIARPHTFFSRHFIAALILLSIGILLNIDTIQNSFIAARISEGVFDDDARIHLISEAFRLIQRSPLVGAGIEPLETYPHNLIIESFLSFGILTGIPFCIMLLATLIRLISFTSKGMPFWIALLFVQYCVAAMFSGSLYGSYIFWVLMVLVISHPTRPQGDSINFQTNPSQ